LLLAQQHRVLLAAAHHVLYMHAAQLQRLRSLHAVVLPAVVDIQQ
jgi:hypothetical protein